MKVLQSVSREIWKVDVLKTTRRYFEDIPGTPFQLSRWRHVEYSRHKQYVPEYTFEVKKPKNLLYSCGSATEGALGLHDRMLLKRKTRTKQWKYPIVLPFRKNHEIRDAACGYGFSVIVTKKDDGPTLYGCGVHDHCQIGSHKFVSGKKMPLVITPKPIHFDMSGKEKAKKVACGEAHTMVLTTNSLWTFGNNEHGQCGRPIIADEDYSKNATFYRIPMFSSGEIDSIFCSQSASFIVAGGKLYSCGYNGCGQLGQGHFENQAEFKLIEGDLQGEKVIKVSGAGNTQLALTEKGDVFAWGASSYRQLDLITDQTELSTPKLFPLKTGSKIVDIAATESACVILTEEGDVWTWGMGQIGRGVKNVISPFPQKIPPPIFGRTNVEPNVKVSKLFAGIDNLGAITSKDILYTWGKNTSGSCGLGDKGAMPYPLMVAVSSRVKKVSFGPIHSMILGVDM